MTRAEEIRTQMRNMELMYDNLFSSRSLCAVYDALSTELRSLPAQSFNRQEHAVARTAASIREEIKAIRFLRSHGADPVNRIAELRRVWPHYKAARRELVAA